MLRRLPVSGGYTESEGPTSSIAIKKKQKTVNLIDPLTAKRPLAGSVPSA